MGCRALLLALSLAALANLASAQDSPASVDASYSDVKSGERGLRLSLSSRVAPSWAEIGKRRLMPRA